MRFSVLVALLVATAGAWAGHAQEAHDPTVRIGDARGKSSDWLRLTADFGKSRDEWARVARRGDAACIEFFKEKVRRGVEKAELNSLLLLGTHCIRLAKPAPTFCPAGNEDASWHYLQQAEDCKDWVNRTDCSYRSQLADQACRRWKLSRLRATPEKD